MSLILSVSKTNTALKKKKWMRKPKEINGNNDDHEQLDSNRKITWCQNRL